MKIKLLLNRLINKLSLLLPTSLFGRLLMIYLLGSALLCAALIFLFVSEQQRFSERLAVEHMADNIISSYRKLSHMPPSERPYWLDALSQPGFRLRLEGYDAEPLQPNEVPFRNSLFYRELIDHLNNEFGQITTGDLRWFSLAMPSGLSHPHRGHRTYLQLGYPLPDGQSLFIQLRALPQKDRSPSRTIILLTAFLVIGTLISLLAVRQATKPFSLLAQAADQLGEDLNGPPIHIERPLEARHAAEALNKMQNKLRQQLTERLHLLAAISHDLQTPITRLKLRAEMLDDETQRERFHRDLDFMSRLVREGLDLARSQNSIEPLQKIKLLPLIEEILHQAEQAGHKIRLKRADPVVIFARRDACYRAIWNLIDNCGKYAEGTEVEIRSQDSTAVLEISDVGPGIPEEFLEQVFEPFFRLEPSRSRQTGGSGLGLTIARNLLLTQQATIKLENKQPQGLRITIGFRQISPIE